jgi:hypothetical protein
MSQRLEIVTADQPPPVWAALRNEAAHAAQVEPGLASLLHSTILPGNWVIRSCAPWACARSRKRLTPATPR